MFNNSNNNGGALFSVDELSSSQSSTSGDNASLNERGAGGTTSGGGSGVGGSQGSGNNHNDSFYLDGDNHSEISFMNSPNHNVNALTAHSTHSVHSTPSSRGGTSGGPSSRAGGRVGRGAGRSLKSGGGSHGHGGANNNEEHDMQAKLVATWQTIELSSHKRLSFMQKYSTDMYSVELGRATDLWAEAAVFVVARLCCLKLANKFFGGYCVMPVLESELTTAFTSHIHPLLSSASTGLIPQTLHSLMHQMDRQTLQSGSASVPGSRGGIVANDEFGARSPSPFSHQHTGSPSHHQANSGESVASSAANSPVHTSTGVDVTDTHAGTHSQEAAHGHGHPHGARVHTKKEQIRRRSLGKDGQPVAQLKPLSSTACDIVLSTFHESFAAYCDEEASGGVGIAHTDEIARSCIVRAGKAIDSLLLKSLKRTQDELDDIVYYGDIACKDWMAANTLY